MAHLYSTGYSIGGTGIAKNSLDIKSGDLLAIKGGFVDKAVVGDEVVGISTTTKVYDADNETVKGLKVEYVHLADDTLVKVKVENGDIDQSKVGTLFNLNASGDIDGATSGAGTQMKLKQVVSGKEGIFISVQK